MDKYNVDLLSSAFKDGQLHFDLDDDFFAAIDGLIDRGQIKTTVDCRCTGSMYKFQIHSAGTIVVPCDRCLADLELRIDTTDELVAKLGDEYCDDGECVIVPETEGYLNLAQFIYEFIALSMPITCCHEPGKCDDSMMQELSKHQAARSGREDEESDEFENTGDSEDNMNDDLSSNAGGDDMIDPRWAALKKLKG